MKQGKQGAVLHIWCSPVLCPAICSASSATPVGLFSTSFSGSQVFGIAPRNLPAGSAPSIDPTISRTRADQICSKEFLHLPRVSLIFSRAEEHWRNHSAYSLSRPGISVREKGLSQVLTGGVGAGDNSSPLSPTRVAGAEARADKQERRTSLLPCSLD